MAEPADTPNLYGEPADTGSMLLPRGVALDIITKILDQRKAFDEVLERHEAYDSLALRDRAFVRMLCATVLRRLIQLDMAADNYLDAPQSLKPSTLRHILRLGAAQIMFLDHVPPHAAVNTGVMLAEQAGHSRAKGLINAVLRRIAENAAQWARLENPGRINTPGWLFQHWVHDYGAEMADHIAAAHMAEAPLDITVKNPDLIERWSETLGATILPTGTLRRNSGGRIEDLQGYEDGMWWVQDLAASLPVKLFGRNLRGHRVIDLCAAPGGKTAQLAASGAEVVAVDRTPSRLRRLEDNLRRLRLKAQCVPADASVWQPPEGPGSAPFVLLDAPCSATGTIRRHPDIPHIKHPQDVSRLATVQDKLLDNAARITAPGGTLIYCTCALQKDEGENRIDAFLERHPDMEIVPVTSRELDGLSEPVNNRGEIRALPFYMAARGGMDGFFAARLRKRS